MDGFKMKIHYFLISIAAVGLLGAGKGQPETDVWQLFPDGNGNLKLSILVSDDEEVSRIDPKEDVKFLLYTRRGSSQLFVGNTSSLWNSTFDENLPTLMLTHGYRATAYDDSVQVLKNAYLKVKDCNVIAVDWSVIANNILYFVVKNQTKEVGMYIAEMIDFLVSQKNLDIKNLHLSGHSLGAHVMGLAGKNFKSEKVARITGIDPAGPLYTLNDTDDRLATGDADFVDVIHACGGVLAFNYAMGDADFFPNGGFAPMPGCGIDLGGGCSHNRAWQYFAESINSTNFKSLPCGSYADFQAGNCSELPEVPMGEPAPNTARGSYYLNTAASPPFALG